jgi:hypothetical protein
VYGATPPVATKSCTYAPPVYPESSGKAPVVGHAAWAHLIANVDALAACTVNACVTALAGAYVAFPAWLAVIEHVPAAISVTVLPATVHTEGVFEAKLTASPELAVAAIVNGGAPSVWFANAPNAMVCAASDAPPTVTVLGPPMPTVNTTVGETVSLSALILVMATEYDSPAVAAAGTVKLAVPSVTVPVNSGLTPV